MTEQTTKVEVKVGPFDERGEFLGEIVRFTAEEVGFYREHITGDTRGNDYTLYRLPDGTFRVLVENWSRWQGEGSFNHLYPNSDEHAPDVVGEGAEEDPYGSMHRPVEYSSYFEAEARQLYPHVFAACGMPNLRELD